MSGPYVDDATIADSDQLWRRIHPDLYIFDDNLGVPRASSAAFRNSSDGSAMSVLLGDMVVNGGRTADDIIAEHPGHGVVSFAASLVRALKQGVMRVPLDDEPAHAEVFGKKTSSVKKALVRESQWIIRPSEFSG